MVKETRVDYWRDNLIFTSRGVLCYRFPLDEIRRTVKAIEVPKFNVTGYDFDAIRARGENFDARVYRPGFFSRYLSCEVSFPSGIKITFSSYVTPIGFSNKAGVVEVRVGNYEGTATVDRIDLVEEDRNPKLVLNGKSPLFIIGDDLIGRISRNKQMRNTFLEIISGQFVSQTNLDLLPQNIRDSPRFRRTIGGILDPITVCGA